MTGFLAALAARAVGEEPALRPRPAQRFEAAAESAIEAPQVSPVGEAAPGPKVDEPTLDPGREREPSGRRVHRDSGPALAADTEPGPSPLDDEPGAVPQVEPAAVATAARQTARHAVGRSVQAPGGDAALPVASPEPHAASLPESSAPLESDLPEEAAPEALIETTPAVTPPREQPPVEAAPAPHLVPEARPRELPPRARRPEVGRRSAPRAPRPVSTPMDLEALLRDEVFAALVERGDVPAGEQAVVESGPTTRAPRPGTAALRAERVRGPALDGADATPGEVHVHIDRVTVTRSGPAPAKPPTPPRTPAVDHAGYLDRRRERG